MFTRFALLHRAGVAPAGSPFVVPRDRIFPRIGDLYARWHPGKSLEDVRGGVGLLDNWNDGDPRPPEVSVPNIDEFLRTRSIRVDGRMIEVDIDPSGLRSLLVSGSALATTRSPRGYRTVRLRTREGMKSTSNKRVSVIVDDVDSLLDNPVVRVPGSLRETRVPVETLRTLLAAGLAEMETDRGAATLALSSPPTEREDSGVRRPVFDEVGGVNWEAMGRPPKMQKNVAALSLRRFPLALFVPFRQRWELLGYSRGAVLNQLFVRPG